MSCSDRIEDALIGAVAWVAYHLLVIWSAIERKLSKEPDDGSW